MAKVIVEHETAHAQLVRRVGCCHEGRYWGKFIDEVICHQERGITELLNLARLVHPLLTRRGAFCCHSKTERSLLRHRSPLYTLSNIYTCTTSISPPVSQLVGRCRRRSLLPGGTGVLSSIGFLYSQAAVRARAFARRFCARLRWRSRKWEGRGRLLGAVMVCGHASGTSLPHGKTEAENSVATNPRRPRTTQLKRRVGG